MKKIVKITALMSILVLAGAFVLFPDGRPGRGGGMYTLLEQLPVEELDESEIQGLLLMREEEKLARDVYTVLYEKWNLNVFLNIAKSEATHMEAVGALLKRYDIDDPVKKDTPGIFSNSELAALFEELTNQGSTSLKNAIAAGTLIEDLDISDLLNLISTTDNDDIKVVYQNLLKGSRNHLRSFVYQAEKNGSDYTPQYISQELYSRIIGSGKETAALIDDPDFSF